MDVDPTSVIAISEQTLHITLLLQKITSIRLLSKGNYILQARYRNKTL